VVVLVVAYSYVMEESKHPFFLLCCSLLLVVLASSCPLEQSPVCLMNQQECGRAFYWHPHLIFSMLKGLFLRRGYTTTTTSTPTTTKLKHGFELLRIVVAPLWIPIGALLFDITF